MVEDSDLTFMVVVDHFQVLPLVYLLLFHFLSVTQKIDSFGLCRVKRVISTKQSAWRDIRDQRKKRVATNVKMVVHAQGVRNAFCRLWPWTMPPKGCRCP